MTYTSTEGLQIANADGVLRLVLDRPEKRNALTDVMMLGLIDALTAAATDDAVRVIVLEGAGENFCGGADILARNADSESKPVAGSIQRRLPTQAHRLIPLMLSVQTPVVCKVRGWAVGIGFQLALAADFTIAAGNAQLWEPFAERGFTPDSSATWLLPRRVGVVRARELLLVGRSLLGTEAAEWGAIHRAVAPDDLDAAVEDLAQHFASGPTVALGLTKWLLHEGEHSSLEQQLSNEALALELSSRAEDFREGIAAFREKRPPRFTGR